MANPSTGPTTWPNMVYPQPAGQSINFAPAAPQPNPTAYVPPLVTQTEIYDEFSVDDQNTDILNTVKPNP